MTRFCARALRPLALSFFAFAFVCCARAAPASAQASQPLRIDVTAERMRVDGLLNEWKGAHFAELGSGEDASLRYALAVADEGLYLAAEVQDEQLVSGEHGDALVLSLVLPEPLPKTGFRTNEVSLLPGQAGVKARARLKLDHGAAQLEPSISVVEGPLKSGAGYVIEAFIPWAKLAGAELWEQGRGALCFVDVDGKGGERTLRTAAGKAAELPRLVLGQGHTDLLGSFMEAHQLVGAEPRYDFRANVAGDARPERVVLLDRYIVVYGPGYHAGESSNYYALPFDVGGGLKHAALRDLTGDGRAELLVTLRQQGERGARDLWLVFSLDEAGIAQRFGAELKKELAGGFVEDSIQVLPPKKGSQVPSIELKAGRAHGLDADSYREQPASDVVPILLPWGELETRSFGFDGANFAVLAETRKRSAPTAASAVAPARGAAAVDTSTAAMPASSGELGPDAVIALFKRERGLASSVQPTHTLRANLLPGKTPEQVDLFGKTIVLTGHDLGQGGAYVTYTLPVDDAHDVLELRASDVTSDDDDELLVRIRQRLSGAAGVTRELLLVLHASDPRTLSRALLVEVARRQGKQAIENHVITRGRTLHIEPGVATGWTQKSYPFTSDPVAPAARLLVPWLDHPVRYRFAAPNLVSTPD